MTWRGRFSLYGLGLMLSAPASDFHFVSATRRAWSLPSSSIFRPFASAHHRPLFGLPSTICATAPVRALCIAPHFGSRHPRALWQTVLLRSPARPPPYQNNTV